MEHFTDETKELLAKMALEIAREIFSRGGTEADFQEWKRKRKEKLNEL